MGQNTKIEWCHHSWNPWRGCTKVSAGCAHCYAEAQAKRNPGVLGVWGDSGTRVIASDAYWKQPLAWDRAAQAAGERHRVFCASMADVFEDRPELVEPRKRLFRLIDATPNLNWLLLTKRPQNIRALWAWGWWSAATEDDRQKRFPGGSKLQCFCQNVWLMTSAENQPAADERIPHLLACRDLAPVLGLSVEPLIGPVNFTVKCPPEFQPVLRIDRINWVIVGGESGPNARPCHVAWIRSIVQQCAAAGVPCFVKQLGANPHDECPTGGVHRLHCDDRKGGDWSEWPEDLRVRRMPEFPKGGAK